MSSNKSSGAATRTPRSGTAESPRSRDRSGRSGTDDGRAGTTTGTPETAGRKVRRPVLAGAAAAAAIAGGAALKRQLAPRRRRVLGVSMPALRLDELVPSDGPDLKRIAKRVATAGKLVVTTSRRLSKLSDELERVGKATQKLGDSLS